MGFGLQVCRPFMDPWMHAAHAVYSSCYATERGEPDVQLTGCSSVRLEEGSSNA